MGAEFSVNTTTNGSLGVTEYDTTLVVPGDSESVRRCLPAALEQCGYRLLNEQPLQARRKAQGWGLWSNNVLDQRITLLLNLKPAGERATRVTFDYTVDNPMLTQGDQQTLQREAEALMALVRHQAESSTCAACGTEGSADSRFCRRCGAPVAAAQPTELEVLRLTAHGRAAHQGIVSGALLLAVHVLLLLPILFTSPSKHVFFIVVSALFGVLAWSVLFFGLRRLQRTLFPAAEPELPPAETNDPTARVSTAALPLQQFPVSVTEGTTELLGSNAAPTPRRQPDQDTA
jgi:hypothetical protein